MNEIGKIPYSIKQVLNLNTEVEKVLISEGFFNHLEKRNHQNMYPYIEEIKNILLKPDYVGVNPREKGESLEYIKIYEDNILIAIKLDKKNDYFYIATMHEISNLKLKQRIKNGRLIKVDKNI